MRKCHFREWLWGPKSHWPEEQQKKKRKTIVPAPPVMCKGGVEAQYGLVPSELGIGYWCGHMVDYDEVGFRCGYLHVLTVYCVFFANLCQIFFV